MGSSAKKSESSKKSKNGRDSSGTESSTESRDGSLSSTRSSSESSSAEEAMKAKEKERERPSTAPLGWPIGKADLQRNSVSSVKEDEGKKYENDDDSKLKKLASKLSGWFSSKLFFNPLFTLSFFWYFCYPAAEVVKIKVENSKFKLWTLFSLVCICFHDT